MSEVFFVKFGGRGVRCSQILAGTEVFLFSSLISVVREEEAILMFLLFNFSCQGRKQRLTGGS